jgi:hypothetical protein
LAQLVNVIAPIVTNANGILRQSIYYPYAWALESARGQALDAWVESAAIEGVPAVDSAVTFDNATGQYCVLLLNRGSHLAIRYPHGLGSQSRQHVCRAQQTKACGARLTAPQRTHGASTTSAIVFTANAAGCSGINQNALYLPLVADGK